MNVERIPGTSRVNDTGRHRSLARVALVLCLLAVAGCDLLLPIQATPPAGADIPAGATIDCGPIVDQALCRAAVAVAITAQLNPPPIASARLRLPRAGDDCLTRVIPCGPETIIVVLQSGDTLQDVPLVRTANGWVRLDLVR